MTRVKKKAQNLISLFWQSDKAMSKILVIVKRIKIIN